MPLGEEHSPGAGAAADVEDRRIACQAFELGLNNGSFAVEPVLYTALRQTLLVGHVRGGDCVGSRSVPEPPHGQVQDSSRHCKSRNLEPVG